MAEPSKDLVAVNQKDYTLKLFAAVAKIDHGKELKQVIEANKGKGYSLNEPAIMVTTDDSQGWLMNAAYYAGINRDSESSKILTSLGAVPHGGFGKFTDELKKTYPTYSDVNPHVSMPQPEKAGAAMDFSVTTNAAGVKSFAISNETPSAPHILNYMKNHPELKEITIYESQLSGVNDVKDLAKLMKERGDMKINFRSVLKPDDEPVRSYDQKSNTWTTHGRVLPGTKKMMDEIKEVLGTGEPTIIDKKKSGAALSNDYAKMLANSDIDLGKHGMSSPESPYAGKSGGAMKGPDKTHTV